MAKRKAAPPARTPATARKTAAGRGAKKKAATRKTSRGGVTTPARKRNARPAQARKKLTLVKKKPVAPKAKPLAAPRKKPATRRPAIQKAPAKSRATQPPATSSPSRRKPAQASQPGTVPRRATTGGRKSAAGKPVRLDRVRRTLDEGADGPAEFVQTPPSSLDLDSHASAARTGRREIAEARRNLKSLGDLTVGDVDADAQNAYFSGDEAPGGDNPTPDQDIVDDIGKAIGLQYQDNEELRASDKVVERDRHRWELDPASSEDFKERK
jgi:hypothetical protein